METACIDDEEVRPEFWEENTPSRSIDALVQFQTETLTLEAQRRGPLLIFSEN